MQKITPFLWYAKEAEEAAAFYASIFPDSRVVRVTALPTESPSGPPGSVKIVEFMLFGQPFMAMSAGPLDPFNHAISFVVNCDDQAELDRYWNALLEGGAAEQCGWLKDRYGLSLADRADRARRDDDRSRPGQGEARRRRDDEDGQAGHRRAAGGLSGLNTGRRRDSIRAAGAAPSVRRRGPARLGRRLRALISGHIGQRRAAPKHSSRAAR